jgi:STE24 endopeptidase
LLVIVLWLWPTEGGYRLVGLAQGAGLFVGGLLLVVLFMGLWSRVLARSVRGANLHRSLRRFHASMVAARVLIPIWFGIAIFGLGWSDQVARMLGPLRDWPVELPGMIIGTLPAMAAWMALWWAQFPADRALREQSLLVLIDENLPIYQPPGFWSYFIANLRLQLLFTVVPVALIILMHDVASVVLWKFFGMDLRMPMAGTPEVAVALGLQFGAIALVVLFAPEVLRRVLHTQSLPDSPLRQRLEDLCRRTGLRYRDILLWRTNNHMGNAAVMGLVPQVRYILLSDVLLETMSDRQIEAVFAHEVGHVKHWHMGWYVVLIATLILMTAGPGQLVVNQFAKLNRPAWLSDDALSTGQALFAIGAFFLIFGYLSRWFERQADVYAARMMQQQDDASAVAMAYVNPATPAAFEAQGTSFVGPHGAAVFASALHRVAVINNIPVSARNFTHGSIADRVRYLKSLSSDPTQTARFDRGMLILYAGMILILVGCIAWVTIAWSLQ